MKEVPLDLLGEVFLQTVVESDPAQQGALDTHRELANTTERFDIAKNIGFLVRDVFSL